MNPHKIRRKARVITSLDRKLRHLAMSNLPRSDELLRSYVNGLHRIFPESYTDADPLKVVWVDPDDIERSVIGSVIKFGRVSGGDWDWDADTFDELPRVSSIREHFEHGREWEDTEFFELEMQHIERYGTSMYGCKNEEQLRNRFSRVDELHQRIESEGYKTQSELLQEEPDVTRSLSNDEPIPGLNEIGVNVGRDGELLFVRCGLHRLAVSKVLDLEKIPVLFRVRHQRWQRRRNQAKSGVTPEHDDHPDLYDLE